MGIDALGASFVGVIFGPSFGETHNNSLAREASTRRSISVDPHCCLVAVFVGAFRCYYC
jgi:hypothetical protein